MLEGRAVTVQFAVTNPNFNQLMTMSIQTIKFIYNLFYDIFQIPEFQNRVIRKREKNREID